MTKDKKSNCVQAEILRLGGEHILISPHVDRSEEEVAQLQARCNDFGRQLEPTQFTRDEGYLSRTGVDACGR